MSLGTRVIFETNGKREKLDLDQLIEKTRSKNKYQARIYSEILLEVNRFVPHTKQLDDRYTVLFISPSNDREFKETSKSVQVRQISYFKQNIYDSF